MSRSAKTAGAGCVLAADRGVLQGLLEFAPYGIVAIDGEGAIVLVNAQVEAMFGYEREELLGQPVEILLPPGLRQAHVRHRLAYGKRSGLRPMGAGMDLQACRRDGREFPVDVSLSPVQTAAGPLVMAIVVDATERRQAEAALRRSRERFRDLVEATSDWVWEVDASLAYTYVSPKVREFLGYEPQEVLGRTPFDLMPPEEARRVGELFAPIAAAQRPFSLLRNTNRHRDGQPVVLESSGVPIFDANGRFCGFRGIDRDLTQHRRLEEELLTFKLGIERSGEAIFLTRTDGTIVYANPAFERLYGFSQEETLGKTPRILKSGRHPAEAYERLWQALLAGQVVAGEVVNKTRDGRLIDIDSSANPILDEEGRIVGFLAIQSDITERKRMEGQEIRLERLQALGEMARGFAHNFNNLLTGVTGNAQLLKSRVRDPELAALVDDILHSADRAAVLVSRLNRSVRPPLESRLEQIEDLEPLVREAILSTQPWWQDEANLRGVTVEVEAQVGQVPAVRGDPTKLRDILASLIRNAVEAMPASGRIAVAVRSCGEWVELEVRDTGSGMDEAARRRVFEPFFTTRQDVGRGLGLAVAHRTIADWGGQIGVQSAPGEGSTFTIRLPACTEPDLGQARDEGPPSRPRKVLVIDDEELIHHLLARALAAHEVVAARDGQEALERLGRGERFDVALIDFGLPGLRGDEVACRMRELDPTAATILITGWRVGGDLSAGREEAFDFQVDKPFRSLEQLRGVVAQALRLHDERSGAQA